ncbi:hypothetical protein ACP4OV_016670 [Aristida adscensionis]
MRSHHHPEPLELELEAAPPPANTAGKMQRLLWSAFKRVEDADQLTRSPSDSSSSSATTARPPSGRRRGGDSAVHGGRSSRDSFELDGSKSAKLLSALREAKIRHAYEAFPWEKKMRELLPVAEASCFLSLLLLPKATDGSKTRYNSLEDTLGRADAWLLSSQAAGVPVVLMSVQTEALLTKISGETALSTVNSTGSLSELGGMANASLYGFEDYHGVDIGVVRAVRLWYAAAAGEAAVELRLQAGDARLGFAISRTEEGFIYVSSVAEEEGASAAARSGLVELHGAARRAARLLVVSRVGGEKVLPWMVSTAGDVKCFDTVSLSQKLSLHRHALRPITLHFLMWDPDLAAALPADVVEKPPPSPLVEDKADDAGGPGLTGNDSRDDSFRFQNIDLLPDSWL